MAATWCKEGLREAADALVLDNATPEDKEIFRRKLWIEDIDDYFPVT